MKAMHIDHIGIAVKDLDAAVKTYKTLLQTSCYKREIVESQNVETAFLQTGESKVELLGATDSESIVAKYIEKRGEGIHHVAFEVDDIHAEIERLTSEGFTLLGDTPKPGADQKQIVFLHPKSSHGVLVELCQTVK